MTDLKIRPPANDLFYVTIDGTRAIDSVTIGQMWQKFGWRNLLDGLTAPAADLKRRTDSAHPGLPIRFMAEARPGKGSRTFSDIVIMPEGVDGAGVDPGNWPSATDKTGNVTQINAANTFVQKFILAPHCDPASSALGIGARTADLVYVSSHGVRTGDMFGQASNDIDEVDPFFILAKAAAAGGKFDGVKWLILSNCNTLVGETHNDWLTLMGASPSFRGILGYQGPSVPADPSAGADVSFVNQLLAGKSVKESWRLANKAWGMTNQWVVLCHDAAKDDTIQDWNDGKLAGIPLAPAVIRLFDEAHQPGVAVARRSDPFAVFWSRVAGGATTKITPANRYSLGNKIATGDDISITVVSAPAAASFATDTVIEVTLIFVREDYPEKIAIDQMFKITATTGIQPAVTTVRRNTLRGDNGADTWVMKVVGTPASITLGLHIDKLFIDQTHHNLPFWLRAKFTAPDGSGAARFDFIHDGAVYSK
jgi:hypothetical protein